MKVRPDNEPFTDVSDDGLPPMRYDLMIISAVLMVAFCFVAAILIYSV